MATWVRAPRELLAAAVRLLPDVSERWVRAALTLQRADLALHLGQRREARDVLRRLVAEARADGVIEEVAQGVASLADLDRAEGRLESAESRYREALHLGVAALWRAAVHYVDFWPSLYRSHARRCLPSRAALGCARSGRA